MEAFVDDHCCEPYPNYDGGKIYTDLGYEDANKFVRGRDKPNSDGSEIVTKHDGSISECSTLTDLTFPKESVNLMEGQTSSVFESSRNGHDPDETKSKNVVNTAELKDPIMTAVGEYVKNKYVDEMVHKIVASIEEKWDNVHGKEVQNDRSLIDGMFMFFNYI